MNIEIDKYENIYRKLKKCFYVSFGDENKKGLIPLKDVKSLLYNRRENDWNNNLPGNSLLEIPPNLYDTLKNTYMSRDTSCVSGYIGCAETTDEQMDGITNMALLVYLSNHLSKQYKEKAHGESEYNKFEVFKKNEKALLTWKHISLCNVISAIYVLENTSDEYKDYFSYGERLDDKNKPSFVIDLPYIGQICVHFGSEEKKNVVIETANNTVKSILQKKNELGQITEEQRQNILGKLERDGVLPEYEGRLYEYVGAFPMEYIGPKTSACRKIIGNKLPEEFSKKDIEKANRFGLNERELYYYFVKMGAPKSFLNIISGESKGVTPKDVEKSTYDLTIEEFNSATNNLKELVLGKENINYNTRD